MANTIREQTRRDAVYSSMNANSYADFAKEFGLFPFESEIILKLTEPNSRIIDLGCGAGRVGFALSELGYSNVTCCDIDPFMLAQAQKRLNSHPTQVYIRRANALQLPFADKSTDLVIFSYNGLMTIPRRENRLKAISEAYRVLRPGGHFVFSCYKRDSHPSYKPFWDRELKRWQKGPRVEGLFEFGDLIKSTQLEMDPVFVHFPDEKEIQFYSAQGPFNKFEHYGVENPNPDLRKLINRLHYYVLTR